MRGKTPRTWRRYCIACGKRVTIAGSLEPPQPFTCYRCEKKRGREAAQREHDRRS